MGRAHDPDSWGCVRLSESPLYIFSIREDGTLLRTRKSDLRETKAKVTFKKGKAFVYIGRLAYRLDSLVALHFVEGYQPNDLIEHIDKSQKNCGAWNLRVIPRSDFAKKTCRNKLCKQVIVDGVIYPSIAACARALYVDESTVQKYLNGTRTGERLLDGLDIRWLGAAGWPPRHRRVERQVQPAQPCCRGRVPHHLAQDAPAHARHGQERPEGVHGALRAGT